MPSPLHVLRSLSLLFLLPLSSCTTIPPSLHVTPEDAPLARRVAKLAAGSGAHMGFVVLHVESGRRLELNAAESFEAASVIKIALLAEAVSLELGGRFDPTDRWRLTARSVAAGSGMLDEFDAAYDVFSRAAETGALKVLLRNQVG